jgi:hypothetical protein
MDQTDEVIKKNFNFDFIASDVPEGVAEEILWFAQDKIAEAGGQMAGGFEDLADADLAIIPAEEIESIINFLDAIAPERIEQTETIRAWLETLRPREVDDDQKGQTQDREV